MNKLETAIREMLKRDNVTFAELPVVFKLGVAA
jgi:hypothetical protein